MGKRRKSRRGVKPKKSWIQKCKDCLRQFTAFLFSNVGIICLVVGYTLAGAFMFKEIEGNPGGANFTHNLTGFYNKTLDNLWGFASTMTDVRNGTDFRIMTEDELIKFQAFVTDGVKINDYDGDTTYAERWSIDAAFLYCLTVITTIGYGNVFPRTIGGKVATIVYAIFGMPLFLLYLSNIGDLLARSFKWLYAKFCLCKICRLRKRRAFNGESTTSVPAISSRNNSWRRSASDKTWSNYDSDKRVSGMTEDEDSDDEDTETITSSSSSTISSRDPQDIAVPISLCLAIMIGNGCDSDALRTSSENNTGYLLSQKFISLGALFFGAHDDLNFMDGSYFCFISLSTIGFGDIVPRTNNENEKLKWSFFFCSVYLMLGMALIAMCFNLMQQDVVQKIRTCTDIIRRLARCRR